MRLAGAVLLTTAACSVCGHAAATAAAPHAPNTAGGLTLRVRLGDGTVKRVQADPEDSIDHVCSQVGLFVKREIHYFAYPSDTCESSITSDDSTHL